MKKIAVLILIISLAFISNAYSQSLSKAGTSAAQFLKIGIGPRAIGMGSAFTATESDLSSIYWNPAGLAAGNSVSAMFSRTEWIADIGVDFAAVSAPVEGLGTIGAFATIMNSIDGMLVRTVDNPEGTGELFDAGSMAIGLSFARSLTDNFAIGFTAKYIREQIWKESAVGFALDVGVLYKLQILNEFRLAASISNFGTKMTMDGRDILEIKRVNENLINQKIEMESWELPLMFRVGVAADLISTNSSRLTYAIDAIHPNDHTEYVNMGAEYSWNEIIFLRAGYKSLFEKDTEEGVSFGVGLNYRLVDALKVRFDYAYQDFGRLENIHYFSFGLNF
ncbi:MAG: PorV/PorQ family protein [Ignavibacteriae bacterium]|jgi:opacity protein-like surface antigen|nr:hypothetical protein [Ignavibacteriota bacterium]NOG99345.1 PorV/PorQ family protein [Ignavibacteriota bacterium]